MNRGRPDLFLDPLEFAAMKALYDSTNGKNWFFIKPPNITLNFNFFVIYLFYQEMET